MKKDISIYDIGTEVWFIKSKPSMLCPACRHVINNRPVWGVHEGLGKIDSVHLDYEGLYYTIRCERTRVYDDIMHDDVFETQTEAEAACYARNCKQ